ncbi:hypothetical protein N7G274_000602 [Stereocaulon virgatum]|uniref:DUF7730 domain-containing protein n=1 Tax=Stereocaulon virgatum TaxID=373712 RepID=A0ABR4ATV2_9LECA
MAQPRKLVRLQIPKSEIPSNASSLLLKLPQELKDKIYQHFCGNQVIHVGIGPNLSASGLGLRKYICHTDNTEGEIQDFFNARPTLYPFQGPKYQHSKCIDLAPVSLFSKTELDFETASYRACHFDTAILLTCREVYHHAQAIRNRTNTYAFAEAMALEIFARRYAHAKDIQNLRLEINVPGLRHPPNPVRPSWSQALRVTARKMSGLSKLHVRLMDAEAPLKKQGQVVAALMQLAELPLNVVTIVLYHGPLTLKPVYRGKASTWPVAEMREWSQDVTRKLLRQELEDTTRA